MLVRIFPIFLISTAFADTSSQYFFCADMNPQQHITIEQLMGMWYGIEILTHNSNEHYVKIGNSCPILHLSEDKQHLGDVPYNTLYKNYNYGYNYGERRPPYPPRTTERPYEYDLQGRPIPVDQSHYQRNYNERRYGSRYHNRDLPFQMKRIRIWWDENGAGTEYHLKYNTSQPGFWISSGPQNGSELEPKFSEFAGTVQVIKAVGNHMVLTFCHRLPERQLITILLSRENKLGDADVHNVHTLLNRKGLSTNAVKKVCWNKGEKVQISVSILLLTILSFSM